MLELDHLAVLAASLEEGAAWLEAALSVPLAPGGRHPAMGTHNRLLSLGPDEYLEVIATDPDAPPPGRARWFGLDAFRGPPRLGAWVLRTDDLDAALAHAPGAGAPMDLARGDLVWRMAVPEDGRLPLGGAHPALIAWRGPHPAPRLPSSGCRLTALHVSCPDPAALRAAVPSLDDPRIAFSAGAPGLAAEIDTPAGPRRLG